MRESKDNRMKSKELRPPRLLLVGWVLVVVLALFSLRNGAQNRRLKNSLALERQRAESLFKESERIRQEKDRIDQGALGYLEWQYVLSEQVTQASKRLSREIRRIKDLKRNKELINLLYYNLGLSFTMAVDFKEAIKAYELAVKFNSKDAESYYNLGLLYSTYHQSPKKAIKYYNKYLQLVSSGQKAEVVRGRIESLKGKR